IYDLKSIYRAGVMMGFKQNQDGALSWGYGQRYVKYDIMGREIFHAETSKIFWLFQQNFLFFSGCIAWCFMTLAMCLILRSP
ncbi:aryl-sulfate sulfotransferase, partial [Salmonella enterica subsp. enterica serovar Cerro]|nr:aryl-sulfate sulfotransferase [Salmonella enterica subsp. enterica serovar Cerro]